MSTRILYIKFKKRITSGIKLVGTKKLREKYSVTKYYKEGGLRNLNEYTLECLQVVGLRQMSWGPLTSEYGDLRATPTVPNCALYRECRTQGDKAFDNNGVRR